MSSRILFFSNLRGLSSNESTLNQGNDDSDKNEHIGVIHRRVAKPFHGQKSEGKFHPAKCRKKKAGK